MTVSYSDSLVKLLLRWKGSIWKAVWKEFFVWLAIYYCILFLMKYVIINTEWSELISELVRLFHEYTNEFPIDFTLSFYVGQVVTRWWRQVVVIPWPDELMNLVISSIDGDDKHSRSIRYAIGRYLVLSQTLALRNISIAVRKRFPTVKHFVDSNLMTDEELKLYEHCSDNLKWLLPLCWAQSFIVEEAVDRNGNALSSQMVTAMVVEMNKYRTSLRRLCEYNWICIPLVYTQATGIGLYGYFTMCLIGDQHLTKLSGIPVPIMTILEFLFYIGWYKVAQKLMQPFGEGDDDIEMNYLFDRHMKIVQRLADFSSQPNPALTEDKFYINRDLKPPILYHTKFSAEICDQPPKLHASFRAKYESLGITITCAKVFEDEILYF